MTLRRKIDLGLVHLSEVPKAGELGRWGALATLRRSPPEPPAEEDVQAVLSWAQQVVQQESSGGAVYSDTVGGRLMLWLSWFDQRATGSWYVLCLAEGSNSRQVYYSTGDRAYCNLLCVGSDAEQASSLCDPSDLSFCANWPSELQ